MNKNYRIPPEKFDELTRYGESVIVECTKGEIAAHCDRQEANFRALNLAHEIVTGKRGVEAAHKLYAETMRAKKHPEYTKGFLFEVPHTEQGDPDKEVFASR